MMEYNNYYPVQPGQPPPPPNMMNNQSDCLPIGGQMMTPNGPPMIQPSPAPSTPHSMRQTPGPPPMQVQQHMAPGPQMHQHQQPSPHPIYHQLPQHPPISHSASPHPSSTPHAQQPPPRPSTGPSPLHHQSPIHINGPSPQLQSVNQLGPPSQPQTPGLVGPPPPMHGQPMPAGVGMNHHPSHNFVGSPMPHQSSPHYGHSPMNPHQHSPAHPPPMMHHHGGPPQLQTGPPHQHNVNMGVRGPQAPGSMSLHPPPPPPPVYMMSPHPPPPQMHHQQQHHPVGNIPPPMDRGSPFYPQIPHTEFRIIELNKRLQERPRPPGPPRTLPIDQYDEGGWWRRFACDFFDDEATLSLRIPGEEKASEFTIGRTLIPRFFRSYFDGGVMDFSIKLRNIRETIQQPGFVTLDCDQTDITTKNYFRHHGASPSISVVVHTEGHLSVDFVGNSFDNLLIKSWRFYVNQCHEYVDRSMTAVGMTGAYLAEPVTKFGLTKNTLNFLKMCMIMEPMQDLMIHHKQTDMKPRACLKYLLQDRYKLKIVDDNQAQPNKRRRRKTAANGGSASGTTKKSKVNNNGANVLGGNPMGLGNNMMQPNDAGGIVPNIPLASQDVLVVGEPSMLGADFGDENERRITRLENNQFDPSTSLDSINDNNNHIREISQQLMDGTGANVQQVDGNHMGQNNLLNQQQQATNSQLQQQNQAPQTPMQQQQQQQQSQPQQQALQQQQQQLQQQQQQSTVSKNDPLNQNLSDQQSQLQSHSLNNLPNHDSYQESGVVDEDVTSMLDYNSNVGDQVENMLGGQSHHDDQQHALHDSNIGSSSQSRDFQQAAPNNCNNNNNNNNNTQMNSFLMNGNDGHINKSEIDLKQQQQQVLHQQQQHQTMTTTGPTPVTETEAR